MLNINFPILRLCREKFRTLPDLLGGRSHPRWRKPRPKSTENINWPWRMVGGVDPSEASLALAFNVFFTSIPLNKPDKTSCEFIRYLVMILGQNCHHLVGSRHESIWNTHLSREKKPALLSIESWLYDRDPYRRSSPTNPLNDQGHKLFIAHLFKIWSQQTSGFERDENTTICGNSTPKLAGIGWFFGKNPDHPGTWDEKCNQPNFETNRSNRCFKK